MKRRILLFSLAGVFVLEMVALRLSYSTPAVQHSSCLVLSLPGWVPCRDVKDLWRDV